MPKLQQFYYLCEGPDGEFLDGNMLTPNMETVITRLNATFSDFRIMQIKPMEKDPQSGLMVPIITIKPKESYVASVVAKRELLKQKEPEIKLDSFKLIENTTSFPSIEEILNP
jgi:hypothetical protein